MARYGMVIDLALCTRCRACIVACKTEHQIPPGKEGGHEYHRMSVLEYETGKYPTVKRVFAPILCMHCETAPCIDVCPIPGAIYRREDGIVVVNKGKCDGCMRCMIVCPYSALYLDEENRVVDKCDLCADRLDHGLEPACVATCMGKAIAFGDLDDPDSQISRLVKGNSAKPNRPLFPLYFSQVFKPSVYYTDAPEPSHHSNRVPYKKNAYSQEMVNAVVHCMKEGAQLHYYPKCEECVCFETEFAEFCGRKYAVSNTSGSASLHITLLACNIGRGDEVLLTPHVAYAVGNTVLSLGAKPVFVDIDGQTLTMDPSKIEEKITPNTKAIIPVHTYGHPADMESIMEISRKYDLFVIEDGTHAIGSRYRKKRLPVGGDKNIGIFSLNWKQLWLPSGGGMIVTDEEEIAKKAMLYRGPHGPVIGYNYLMHNIAAAVGRTQLRHLENYVEMQRSSAKILNELLEDTSVVTPVEKEWAYHAYARYAILAPKRDKLMEFLRQQGIECKALYPTPTHLLKSYREQFGYKEGDFPIAEKEKKEELSLPEPRFRNRWELEYIAKKIVEFYA